ncbi:MAG: ribose-phosphate diphosphokinase [Treponema sp.]|jgi:ribose-phosphate pyrophosphokinase|nr:ribose-phosphate diphosphokinase [Treponema sp.]
MSDFIVCATRSMRSYADGVITNLSKYLSFSKIADQINGLDLLKTDCFADGEIEVTVNHSIRGKDVVIFSSSARNEAGIGVEEAKIELYHAVDALKRSQAHRIIVFEPFISCSRSDRTTRRSSVGLWVHLKTLCSLGVRHIVTFQLHSDKSKTMVDPAVCAIDDIPALTLLKRHLCDVYIKSVEKLENEVKNNWAFCSVDAGGEKLARIFANAFGAPLVVAHKQRDYSKVNTVESINILSAEPLEGKSLWIVDDMIDTAGSVEKLIRTLANHKPKDVNVIAVHALFSPPAAEKLKALSQEGLLQRIIVSDTVCFTTSASNNHSDCSNSITDIPNLEIVQSKEQAAKIIKAIVNNESMSNLLLPFNAALYLNSKKEIENK